MGSFASRISPEGQQQSAMVRSLVRLLTFLCFGSLMIMAALPFAEAAQTGRIWAAGPLGKVVLLVCVVAIATVGFHRLMLKLGPFIDAQAAAQAQFLDSLNPNWVDLAILLSAALSLFLELSIIRWQSSVFEFFAFYKNFSLLACFMGLGLGYALAASDRIPMIIVIPLLAWEFAFMILVRLAPFTPFRKVPFREQLTMGVEGADLTHIVALYALLGVVFLITALAFLPVGQLCGRVMERRVKLRAYGLNLLGSLLGVAMTLAASSLWTPPIIWFSLCCLAILLFQSRRSSSLVVGLVAAAICTVTLAWPVDPLWSRIYSPYQMLEIGRSADTGLTLVRAAGHYFQRIHDFSAEKTPAALSKIRSYYDFPYKSHPQLADVAVVGSGTGNDVAAALRARAGRIEAIEIDPAIVLIGKSSHPEKPYDNPKVHAVVNDARSFLRETTQKFDLIVYGLLDSHTLLSHGSSVRLDSFVYTVEGLREARSRLKPDGVISLSFSTTSDPIGRKIYLTLQDAFDGRPPVCVAAGYDGGAVIFLESNDPNWMLSTKPIMEAGFADRTVFYANPSLQADVSTDDWPFFYMPRRVYPTSYLVMVFLVLALTVLMIANFGGRSEQVSANNLSFFFLGAGFMLVETKGITELGLTFGNTWQVIGVVIGGILTMAFLGNCAVQWLGVKRARFPFLFLLAALAVGWLVARSGGFGSTWLGRLETVAVLTGPLLFSGIAFSTLLASKGCVSGVMAANLLGAICGGLLEYNSMYFGFRSLYLVAMACYLLAFASEWIFKGAEGTSAVPLSHAAIGLAKRSAG